MPIRKNIRRKLVKLRSRMLERRRPDQPDGHPGAGELLSLEQLRQRALELGRQYAQVRQGGREKLLPRLSENEGALLRAHETLREAFRRQKRFTPAEEWLADNFHVIEEQIQTISRHFPRRYGRQLPHLVSGPLAGWPRVYALVIELLASTDDRVDDANLGIFVKACQENAALTIGELWAIPIMLRLALIEKLRRTSSRIIRNRHSRENAAHWAGRALETAEKNPRNLVLLAAEMARADIDFNSAFTAEFTRLIQGQNPRLIFLVNWVEQRLNESGLTIEQQVYLETHHQTLSQASIANNLASFRFIESADWQEFVESVSRVETILRSEPADIYNRMDFSSRDRYRDEIEKISLRAGLEESETARKAVELAGAALRKEGPGRAAGHVGYYLVGAGRGTLEKAAGTPGGALRVRLRRAAAKSRLAAFLSAALLLNAVLTAGILEHAWQAGPDGTLLAAAGVFLFIALSHLSFLAAGWLFMGFIPPRPLPRLDYSGGVPPESRTLVAVPCLLTGAASTRRLLDNLEMCFLANQDENISWALLSDFPDAPSETMPGDDELLALAEEGTRSLNARHGEGSRQPFLLLHRPRTWNGRQGKWMGYERKRGKLSALNTLLHDGDGSAFSKTVGRETLPVDIRFVITLDADTFLPREAARELIATMSHPLNRPVVCPRRNRVVSGYGVLQPRLAVNLASSHASLFARYFSGEPGLDPYTRLVSDLYQDIFGEGSFLGKGIYDLETFHRVLEGRFPDNLILSHDLLEGCHIRSGLVSDILVYEDFPASCQLDMQRRHRWVRGDWQIVHWLLPWVPSPDGPRRNPVSLLGRWKILDNLRRSLVPPAVLAAFIVGWAGGLGAAWFLSAAAAYLAFPVFSGLFSFLRKGAEISLLIHLRRVVEKAAPHLVQAAWAVVSLPAETVLNLDAVFRTLGRLLLTRRNLLEWKSFGETLERAKKKRLRPGAGDFAWAGPGLVALALVLQAAGVIAFPPQALPLAAAWALLPLLAWLLNRPRPGKSFAWSPAREKHLRRLALKYWSFFENFTDRENNWLTPDNYQETPVPRVAHRTSPTNIGLSLLSGLAALDFGLISPGRCLERTARTLETMSRLERFRGHFYNWYDTRTLDPLPPRYISSVDSGNLSGHLLVLREGLLEIPSLPILGREVFRGLQAALEMLVEASAQEPTKHSRGRPETPGSLLPRATRTRLGALAASLDRIPGAYPARAQLVRQAGELADEIFEWSRIHPHTELEQRSRQFRRQCRDLVSEIEILTPWVFSDEAAGLVEHGMFAENPTLLLIAGGRVLRTGEEPGGPLLKMIEKAARAASGRLESVERLARQCLELSETEYDFLYDRRRKLMAIGYRVPERKRDEALYDLLASEARLGSFVAIAEGRLPQKHWFNLGRLLTVPGSRPCLVSWSGSMFEYLMPSLVMPDFPETLIADTVESAVAYQVEYGRSRGVPWGFSESCYNSLGPNLDYQYSSFGVPELGLKRGLAADLVVAPYATMLALVVSPEKAWRNIRTLSSLGFEGHYGFYEAIDYTPSRLPRDSRFAVIRSFMAHHQGMSLLALAQTLLDRPMQKRFLRNPAFRATEILLQEKISRISYFAPRSTRENMLDQAGARRDHVRTFTTPHTRVPQVHLLSNGRFTTMVSAAGGGFSRWNGVALNRWREDGTRDDSGTFIYLRDTRNGRYWSNAYQPTLDYPVHGYSAVFSQSRAEIRRIDEIFTTETEIVVSSEEDAEVRRVKVTNRDREARTLEITTCLELALVPQSDYITHPAFNNLFVNVEAAGPGNALLASRRPRSPDEKTPWAFQLLNLPDQDPGLVSVETDREVFLGRHGSPERPAAMEREGPLGGRPGPVLDPVFALRGTITIPAGEAKTFYLVSGFAPTREKALELVEKFQGPQFADRAFELAWTHSQVLLRQLDIQESEAQLYGRMAGSLVYNDSLRRARQGIIAANRSPQSGLWGYGISGDYPVVLLRVESVSSTELVRQMIRAHAYWRSKGLTVELVIWNEEAGGYQKLLQDHLTGIVSTGSEAHSLNARGGIFIVPLERVPEEDRILMQAISRLIFSDRSGSLAEQAGHRSRGAGEQPALKTTRPALQSEEDEAGPVARSGHGNPENGYGQFSPEGNEYLVRTAPGRPTPAPWCNIVANRGFGFVISESGSAYTWRDNAHEFRLTPWYNDPVTDRCGEAFYIRDEESGFFWSPTPLPRPGRGEYLARHGFGYSVFETREQRIESEMTTWVDADEPARFVSIRLTNRDGRARQLSVTGFVEWVLGQLREGSSLQVVTDIGTESGAVLARNAYNQDFSAYTAFFAVNDPGRQVSGDRAEFIGRNGRLARPAAMGAEKLSGRVGAGFDPCGALRTLVRLEPGETREVVFLLGAGLDRAQAKSLALGFLKAGAPAASLEKARRKWAELLGRVSIRTGDREIDLPANGWLLYQAISGRILARTGYYQSSGAVGFRDQLQDAMATVLADPSILREQVITCSAHQFPEGDVQHWWHPPGTRGVRTRISDDLLWLPMAVARLVEVTGDASILDEETPFLEGRPLRNDEEQYYDQAVPGTFSASVYEHCRRALSRALRPGAHGLPLMGGGDWNDGMNLVGAGGRGESVWLGFFLCGILDKFAPLADARGDARTAARYREAAAELRGNIEKHAWDGEWYLRAWFDDGRPLGSRESPECRIDSLSQSWAALSGAGDPERTARALESARRHLVDYRNRLIRLLSPPFDKSDLEPGYIKGYQPGVRENGGQYTQAAVWFVMALAALGQAEKAWKLLGLINPVALGTDREHLERYRLEPYVTAGDVCALEPLAGRGGWSWYTGSAGWMYQLIIEWLVGLRRRGNRLELKPCWPAHWRRVEITYRHGQGSYRIVANRSTGTASTVGKVTLEGKVLEETGIPLFDTTGEKTVEVELVEAEGARDRA